MDLYLVLLLIAGLLIVVSLIQPLAVRLGVSPSVMLAVVGVIIGVVADLIQRGSIPGFGAAAKVIVNVPIAPKAFLSIFLPMLLFESALNIEVKRIVEDAAAILLLAVVAVVISTVVIGVALAPIAGVSIIACLMLGSIVATTDPVAVIGIFRDVGAPSRLSRLVEGESLLNDAAAITFFGLLLEIINGGHAASVGAATLTFLRNFAGGVAVGYFGARLIVAMLRWLLDMRLAQVTLTLALPYLVYLISEEEIGVSGVVAAVTAGLVMSDVGQAKMAPGDWRFLHEVWEQLAFWASSLIFILASLRVPRMVVSASWHDLILLIVVIVAAFAARALVLFGLLPILSALHLSQRINGRFKLAIVWGGLRGAVTLVLALAVTENPAISHSVQRFIGVLATGFVFFTLLVNGTTLRLLIKALGLDRLSPLDQALRNQVLDLSRERVTAAVRTFSDQYKFNKEITSNVAGTFAPRDRASNDALAADMSGDLPNRFLLGLIALAHHERELVLQHFAERMISGRIIETLLAGAGRLVDRTRAGGKDQYMQCARYVVDFSPRFRLAHYLHRRTGIDGPLVDCLADRFEALLLNRIMLEEMALYLDEKLAPLFGEVVTDMLREILTSRQHMTATSLEALRQQYSAYAEMLEHRIVRKIWLRREEMEYQTLYDDGVIGPELYGAMRRELQARRAGVEMRPELDLGLDTRELISRVSLFAKLETSQLDSIARLLFPRFAIPDEEIIRDGTHADAMYFISSGGVEVRVVGKKIPLGAGQFFGEMALVSGHRRQGDVVATSYCQLLVLHSNDFKRLLVSDRAIKEQIDNVARDRILMNQQSSAPAK